MAAKTSFVTLCNNANLCLNYRENGAADMIFFQPKDA